MKRTTEEDLIRQRIKAGQALYKKSNTSMARRMGMSESSWERRLAYPRFFKLDELLKIDSILHTDIIKI